jgi:hypothetical protein
MPIKNSPLFIGTQHELTVPSELANLWNEHNKLVVFQAWLEHQTNFRYMVQGSEDLRFSVSRDTRGYWIASRKCHGKLRQKRMGSSEKIANMTPADFYRFAKELTGGDWEEQRQLRNPEWTSAKINELTGQLNSSREKIDFLMKKMITVESVIDEKLVHLEPRQNTPRAKWAVEILRELKSTLRG